MTENSYENRVLRNIYSSWKNNRFCDLIVYLDNQEFKLHKVVIAAGSPVLRNYLISTQEIPPTVSDSNDFFDL